VILLGMFWKRTTAAGGFWGLLLGIVSSVSMFLWVRIDPSALSIIALSPDAKSMAENLYRGLWCFIIAITVTVVVSLFTTPKPVEQLDGLVYGATRLPEQPPVRFYGNQWFWASVVVVIFVALNILFW
jgi:SSS family solute:Na+ symporter